MKYIHTPKKGFTLIEVMIVVALMITIGVFSMVFYGSFILRNAASDAESMLVGSLRKAQWNSMMGKYYDSWGVKVLGDTVTVFRGNSYASRVSGFDEVFILNPNISISGTDEWVFSRLTGETNAGSIVVQGGNSTKNIAVNNQGIIQSQ